AARLGQHPLHRPTRRFRLAAAGRARQFPTRGGASRTSPAVYTADARQAGSAFPITANMEILGSLPVACKRLAEGQPHAGPGSRIGFCSHRIACGLDASQLSVVATPRGGDSVGESYGLAHLQQFPDEIPCGQRGTAPGQHVGVELIPVPGVTYASTSPLGRFGQALGGTFIAPRCKVRRTFMRPTSTSSRGSCPPAAILSLTSRHPSSRTICWCKLHTTIDLIMAPPGAGGSGVVSDRRAIGCPPHQATVAAVSWSAFDRPTCKSVCAIHVPAAIYH